MRIEWMPLPRIVLVCAIAVWHGHVLAAEQNTSLRNTDGTLTGLGVQRFTDWGARWKEYPTTLSEWKASVSYVGASGSKEGLVAPCGDSGLIVYISRMKRAGNSIQIAEENLRTGITQSFELPKLNFVNDHGQYNPVEDLREISCSPDGSRVALTFKAILDKEYFVQKNFLVELRTLNILPLDETLVDRSVEITGRPINSLFTVALGKRTSIGETEVAGMRILPIENIVDEVKKVHSNASRANIFLENNSASIVVSGNRQEQNANNLQPITYIHMAGEGFSRVRKCSIPNYQLRYSQPASGGVILTVSPSNDMRRSRLYYVKLNDSGGGVCDMKPMSEWISAHEREMLGYAGDYSTWSTASFSLPKEAVDTFRVDFSLSITEHVVPFFSSQIEFKGISEELPLVLAPLSLPSTDQFTFVYGPHGAGTAFVHLWKTDNVPK
jgi:hypothetical protein